MTDHELARLLLDAHGHAALPPAPILAPILANEAQAYRVQALVMAELGPIGGWKVGAPAPDGPITCAPMPASFLCTAPHAFDSAIFTQRDVESEICFRLATDLPPRPDPYTAQEVTDAIATCHPGIEILQSRYATPNTASHLALLADLIQTGAYVTGQAIESWRTLDFTTLTVHQTITPGSTRVATGNPAGNMIRLLTWLANHGAVWAGGLRANQLVTCGSWTGKTACPATSEVRTAFTGAAPIVIRFA